MITLLQRLRDNVAKIYLGSADAVDRVLICLLARGHLLIEDVPGVGKTVLATSLARSIACSFSRVQLTPDLLPSDILGVTVFDRNSGEFSFSKGPIFANVVLADEINRTPPRTQAALLEAMNENAVSIDGRTIPLDPPFMVIATQNPHDFEGTYPLPENQLDRFLMRISLGYPTPEQEARVLSTRPAATQLPDLAPVLQKGEMIALQAAVDDIRIERVLIEYIIALANATRRHDAIEVGLSPRATLALAQAAKSTAFVRGRDHVIPEDVTFNLESVGAHRIVPRGGNSTPSAAIRALQEAVRSVPAPA